MSVTGETMKSDLVLLAALLLVALGILAAGCVSPGGNPTQPTETSTATGPTVTETRPATVTTAPGGQPGY